MKGIRWKALSVMIAVMLPLPGTVFGRIKLAALPSREAVHIMLDDGRVTLVEEERIVPLLASDRVRGNNRIDFSWSNTAIDGSSIRFRPLAVSVNGVFQPLSSGKPVAGVSGPEVRVISVSYPPGENALVWEVYAARSCAVKVRVSYIIGRMQGSYSYRAVVNSSETALELGKYLQVQNGSGEGFQNTKIWTGFSPVLQKDLPAGDTLQVLVSRFRAVSLEKEYRFDWYRNGRLHAEKPLASRVMMYYKMKNNKENGLGDFMLQPGKVRIFMRGTDGGSAFLGEDLTGSVPVGETMQLYLGDARDIVCRRKVIGNERHPTAGGLYHQEVILSYEVENYKRAAVRLKVTEQMRRLVAEYGGCSLQDIEWRTGSETDSRIKMNLEKGSDFPSFMIELPPAKPGTSVQKTTVKVHFVVRNLWQK